MKTFNVGDILAAADVNEYLVNTHFAFKNSNTTRTSAPNATNDPDLNIAVDANKIYMLYCYLAYNSGATPGFQNAFSVPSGTTLGGVYFGPSTTSVMSAPGNLVLLSGISAAWPGGTNDLGVICEGIVNTGSTAGNIIVQWGQQTSSATNTTLKTGSCLFLRRVS
jgi:hypothetical protein